MTNSDSDNEKILLRLRYVEERLKKVEEELGIKAQTSGDEKPEVLSGGPAGQRFIKEDSWLEMNFGEYGLTWLGNLVLMFGIAFLNYYLSGIGLALISIIAGYLLAAGVFVLSNYIRSIHSYMSFVLKLTGHFLLFYITLRLHFFSTDPLIDNSLVVILILLAMIAIQSFVAIRSDNPVMAGLSLLFALVTAVLSNLTHVMLPLGILISAASIFYYFRYLWKSQLIIMLLAVYFVFLLWLFNNPLLGQTSHLLLQYKSGLMYLFLTVLIFSLVPFSKKDEKSSGEFVNIMTVLNGFMFLGILGVIVFQFFRDNYVWIFSAISLYCLLYSVFIKKYTTREFAASFYALYGFVAMSIAMYGIYNFPRAFWLLAIQSLLVVSMALWFRSKIIVIMNSLLFGTLLLVYLVSSGSVDRVNFAFALVALVTARILNWKRKLLEIETDLMRNFYLLIGFFMMLFSLYHALPGKYVTLSWTVVALLYFLLSFLLKNFKYRFMALGTMVAAAIYLFIVDLAQIDLIFRVIALLFLSLISIVVSVYYSKRINKTKKS
jgi:hypothetical protein